MSTCLIPFNQLYIHSSGNVYPCSFVQNNPDFVLGHIQEQTIEEIWNSEASKKLRAQHEGILPKICERNQKTFLCHKVSVRDGFNQDQKLKRLDIMLDSACNLTCIMCTNIYDKTGGLKGPFFWEKNKETFSDINQIELVGGEPLISPYFDKIVNLVTSVNDHCDWRITTNAHYVITDKLLQNFKKIKLKTISISLDSLNPQIFQAIRQRSEFNLVYENIQKLKNEIPLIQINTVIQSLNCDEIISMYNWTQEQGFHFYPILLVYPPEHSIVSRKKEQNKAWILKVMRENEKLKSKEIFFLIKKALRNVGLEKDPDVLSAYLDQLKLMEGIVV